MIQNSFKFIVLLGVVLLSVSCIGHARIKGSGNVVYEQRHLDNFRGIRQISGGEIFISQGDQFEILIEADDQISDYIISSVSDDILHIAEDIPGASGFSIKNAPFRSYVTVPTIEKLNVVMPSRVVLNDLSVDELTINVSRVGNLLIKDFQAEKLTLVLESENDIHLENVDIGELTIKLSGSGGLTANGQVKHLDIYSEGDGDVLVADLKTQSAVVFSEGAGDVELWVSESLEGSLLGAGDFSYFGSPKDLILTDSAGKPAEAIPLGDK